MHLARPEKKIRGGHHERSRNRRSERHSEAGVGGVFGLITAAMVIVIITIATFGPNVRGRPLDAL
jgi:hypothetical protein